MHKPVYLPIRKCSSFWTWLWFRRSGWSKAICVFGWDFYG